MNRVAAVLAAALALLALAISTEASPVASRLLLSRPRVDAALAGAEWPPQLVPASGEPGSRRGRRVGSDADPGSTASARPQPVDAATGASQPARSRQPLVANGQIAQQGSAGHARPEQRALLDWTQRPGSPAQRRDPARSHSPVAHRRPAQPSPVTAAVARHRRAALSRAQALLRLRERLRRRRRTPPLPAVSRKAARSKARRPAVPHQRAASPHHSRKQPRSKRTPARKPARNPVRRPTKRPAKPAAVKAVVSLNGNGNAASGAAKTCITKAPLVQQHSPAHKVHRFRTCCLALNRRAARPFSCTVRASAMS